MAIMRLCKVCHAISGDSEDFFINNPKCIMCGAGQDQQTDANTGLAFVSDFRDYLKNQETDVKLSPRDEYYASKQTSNLANETITHLQADIQQLKSENLNLGYLLEKANDKCEALEARVAALNRPSAPYEF